MKNQIKASSNKKRKLFIVEVMFFCICALLCLSTSQACALAITETAKKGNMWKIEEIKWEITGWTTDSPTVSKNARITVDSVTWWDIWITLSGQDLTLQADHLDEPCEGETGAGNRFYKNDFDKLPTGGFKHSGNQTVKHSNHYDTYTWDIEIDGKDKDTVKFYGSHHVPEPSACLLLLSLSIGMVGVKSVLSVSLNENT